MSDKKADLAGPGISTYEEVEKILPNDYEPLQPPLERMEALFEIKESGVNDMLDRDGSRTPVEFPCGLGLEKRLIRARSCRRRRSGSAPR